MPKKEKHKLQNRNKQKDLILVIDDQSDNLHYLKLVLKDYRIENATSAKEGIRKAKELKPDLILLDIMMPEIDGFEACKILKENKETRDIPVIFVTARIMLDDVIKGFDLGANDYITKPFEPAELLVRVRTHLELQNAKKKILEQTRNLQILNEEKYRFLKIAAHDLKNPLKVVQGFTKLILDRNDSLSKETVMEFLIDIMHATDNMLMIITDVLTINDLSEGDYEIILQEFDLTELINVLASEYKIKAQDKNIEIVVADHFKNQTIVNDFLKTKHILEQLIANAIAYSPKGTHITLRIEEANGKEKKLGFYAKISVEDQGPGIPDEELPYIFDKFCKISNKPTGNEASSGLGLAIAKELCNILGYDIQCQTKFGEGTSFTILLKNNMTKENER